MEKTKDQRPKTKVQRAGRDAILRRMRVLGIDPGSQTTGWGVVEGDGRKYSLVDLG